MPPRLLYLVTHPLSARLLLRGQLQQMREWGFDVSVVSSPGPDLEVVRTREQVRTVPILIEREISPARDAISLGRLVKVMRELRPHIVNASTPKAGLLGMIAAQLTQVPVRIYLLRGLRLETSAGLQRAVLGATEQVASACAHRVVCVSESLRRSYVEGGYANSEKAVVLGAGASNGVDVARFERTAERQSEALALRRQLGIDPGSTVIGFVGRFVADKGIAELLEAFEEVRREHRSAQLLLVGGDLAGDAAPPGLAQRIRSAPGVVSTGPVTDVAPFYRVMDVLAFPSHREGFPNVPLEAAAAQVPTVGFRATGVVDAVEDGSTGLLVQTGDSPALARSLGQYLGAPELRAAHGRAAGERARRLFSNEAVWQAWREEYVGLLKRAGGPEL